MSNRVLVLGAMGTLGNPVAQCLAERGHTVRVLARSAEKAHRMFGAMAEVVEGDSVDRDQIRKAMGCRGNAVPAPQLNPNSGDADQLLSASATAYTSLRSNGTRAAF